MKSGKEMLCSYQLKIADFYNIPIGNLKKSTLKTLHHIVEFNQSQWLKPYPEFNTQNRIETEKMEAKMEKCC